MTSDFVSEGGYKRNNAQECDTLGHTGLPLVYAANELSSQLALRFPSGEKFECRTIYVYDTKQQNGRPLLAEAARLARWAVEKLRDDQDVAESSLLKWPEGHLPNVAKKSCHSKVTPFTVDGARLGSMHYASQRLRRTGNKADPFDTYCVSPKTSHTNQHQILHNRCSSDALQLACAGC